MVQINKKIIVQELSKLIHNIFTLSEVYAVKIRDIVIVKTQDYEQKQTFILNAVEECYHDVLSDVDLSVVVKLSPHDTVTPDYYMKSVERYGISRENCLGIMFVKENQMYRIIMKNGMRYDLGFDFIYDEKADNIIISMDAESGKESKNADLSLESADKFWFVQIQALAKLYRKDFLIGDHLANMNINETLVLQMILRDIKYETRFHRYGYSEKLEYLENMKCPYKGENQTFNVIAEKIYSAAIAYDKLGSKLNSLYIERKEEFFDIWECYERELKGGTTSLY